MPFHRLRKDLRGCLRLTLDCSSLCIPLFLKQYVAVSFKLSIAIVLILGVFLIKRMEAKTMRFA